MLLRIGDRLTRPFIDYRTPLCLPRPSCGQPRQTPAEQVLGPLLLVRLSADLSIRRVTRGVTSRGITRGLTEVSLKVSLDVSLDVSLHRAITRRV